MSAEDDRARLLARTALEWNEAVLVALEKILATWSGIKFPKVPPDFVKKMTEIQEGEEDGE